MDYGYQKTWFNVDTNKNPTSLKAAKKSITSGTIGTETATTPHIGEGESSKSGSNLGTNAVVGALGGITAGMAVGASREEDPFYTKDATGLERTSLSSNLVREHAQKRQERGVMRESDYVITDIISGIGGGATNGFASTGSPWGAILGALTGGVTSAITGDQERAAWRKKINEEERQLKTEWRDQEARLANIGSVSGAYTEDYNPLSQLLIDQEKKKLDEKMRKSREGAGMKELKTNYYTA